MIFGIIWQCLPFLGEWGTIYQRSIKYKKYARQMQCNDRQQQWQEEEATRDTVCQPARRSGRSRTQSGHHKGAKLATRQSNRNEPRGFRGGSFFLAARFVSGVWPSSCTEFLRRKKYCNAARAPSSAPKKETKPVAAILCSVLCSSTTTS